MNVFDINIVWTYIRQLWLEHVQAPKKPDLIIFVTKIGTNLDFYVFRVYKYVF